MRLAHVLQLAFILAAAVLVYSLVAVAQDGEMRKSCVPLCAMSPNYIGENRSAPDIQLPNLQGITTRLSESRGRTTLLVFWSTTCAACKEQMPSLAELAGILRGDDRFALLTVAVDESANTVQQMLLDATHMAHPFSVLLDPDSKYVLNRYGTRLFPETWIIDRDGIIRARFDGPRDWSSSLVIDLLQAIHRGDSCPAELQSGMMVGRAARLCETIASEQ